ncbi:MAG: hypothetical protein UT63_C0020G0003 [Candidatus Gottesmanbacteria bacterium GW2011_GWC2_39_8]|uniref:Uncharacterized protein n=1 Tax=Candidatus Gottesmanbacteria bacterium GW2011_GWC2_39_8 TaxID=1618450 RepID=A0A0G0PZ78_9BACT|nr:MAG: hypothetical protein UT63_C0020G0003 [Candidatus Gottesmanbacteria bacterium GW2011_GWC2_39_8]
MQVNNEDGNRMKKIAIVGSKIYSGEAKVTNALTEFLQSKGYEVTHFNDFISHYQQRRWNFKLLRMWKRIFINSSEEALYIKNLAERIKSGCFDATIAVGMGDVLLYDLGCIKIYFCRAPMDHENYFKWVSWGNNDPELLEKVSELTKKQLSIFQASDYITFAWKTYEEYIRKYIYDGANILSNPKGGWSGCEFSSRRAVFNLPPAIVCLGGLGRYFINMSLLSRLSLKMPYLFDVYGSPAPDKKYGLRYRGPMVDVGNELTRYQFGLNTVTSEILRRNGFSSKIFTYLSYGLPCLFNEWEKFPHELGGCIPYTEENITEVIERFFDKNAWEELSEQAYAQAQDLLWDKMLTPLLDVLK